MIGQLKIHPPELAALKAAVAGKKRFLEIGTLHGVTAALLAEANRAGEGRTSRGRNR